MEEKLELELVKKFPLILKDYMGDPMKTCMAFGIECGSGWYNMLHDLMEKIQNYCDASTKNGKHLQVIAAQIKSKYASLRFYYDFEGEASSEDCKEINKFLSEAEDLSEKTCEICGKDGKVYTQGWHTTLCEEHAKQKNKTE